LLLLKRQDARIIVGLFYEEKARRVFCEVTSYLHRMLSVLISLFYSSLYSCMSVYRSVYIPTLMALVTFATNGPWTLDNRKLHTHFRLTPRSMTLDDLELV